MNNLDKVFFKSKAVGKLSSQHLDELKSTLYKIEESRNKLKSEIDSIHEKLNKVKFELFWINWFPLKLALKNKITIKKDIITTLSKEFHELKQKYDNHKLGLEILLPDRLEAAFGTLDDKFSKILTCNKIWDVTTSQSIDRVAERTTANNVIERKVVTLNRTQNEKIQCDYKSLTFENINGDNLNIYPQFLFIENTNDFALIDLLEINIDFTLSNFIESENVPSDAEIVDYTWAKSNKDGSRDRRFTDNYQIPVAQYGVLHFSSKSGLNEVYMLSNPESAFSFKKMFDDYKEILSKS